MKQTSAATLCEKTSDFMDNFATKNLYKRDDLKELLSLVEQSENAEELSTMCHLLSSSAWMFMPLDLASALTNRFIQISPNKATAKLLRGSWLYLPGMEYENDEEGVTLLQESEQGHQILSHVAVRPE